MNLVLLGVNHKTAPVSLREKLAGLIPEVSEAYRQLLGFPEIQEILKAELTEIQAPTRWKDIKGLGKGAVQGTQRIMQEVSRLQDFLKKAKEVPEQKDTPKAPPPKNDDPKI